MKQQEIFKKIGDIIKELNEQYEYLQSEEGKFNELELELFSANAHFLVDHTKILKKLNFTAVPKLVPDEEIATHKPAPETFQLPIEPELHQPAPQETTTDAFSAPLPSLIEAPITFDPEPVPEVPTPQEPVVPVEEPETPEPAPVEVPVPEPEPEPIPQPEPTPEPAPVPELSVAQIQPDTFSYIRQEPTVSSAEHTFSISSSHSEDTYEEPVALKASESAPATVAHNQQPAAETEQPVLTLNQKLSAQLRPSGTAPQSSSVSAQPAITDIKSAINLNDKMLFVKDLFNGYSLSYSEAVDLVNRCKNFEEADRFLKTNYAVKNHWADKQTTADKFYAILHRRFPQ